MKMQVQTFRIERINGRRWKSAWSQGATFFHRTFKEAKARHDLVAANLPSDGALVATLIDCPKVER